MEPTPLVPLRSDGSASRGASPQAPNYTMRSASSHAAQGTAYTTTGAYAPREKRPFFGLLCVLTLTNLGNFIWIFLRWHGQSASLSQEMLQSWKVNLEYSLNVCPFFDNVLEEGCSPNSEWTTTMDDVNGFIEGDSFSEWRTRYSDWTPYGAWTINPGEDKAVMKYLNDSELLDLQGRLGEQQVNIPCPPGAHCESTFGVQLRTAFRYHKTKNDHGQMNNYIVPAGFYVWLPTVSDWLPTQFASAVRKANSSGAPIVFKAPEHMWTKTGKHASNVDCLVIPILNGSQPAPGALYRKTDITVSTSAQVHVGNEVRKACQPGSAMVDVFDGLDKRGRTPSGGPTAQVQRGDQLQMRGIRPTNKHTNVSHVAWYNWFYSATSISPDFLTWCGRGDATFKACINLASTGQQEYEFPHLKEIWPYGFQQIVTQIFSFFGLSFSVLGGLVAYRHYDPRSRYQRMWPIRLAWTPLARKLLCMGSEQDRLSATATGRMRTWGPDSAPGSQLDSGPMVIPMHDVSEGSHPRLDHERGEREESENASSPVASFPVASFPMASIPIASIPVASFPVIPDTRPVNLGNTEHDEHFTPPSRNSGD